MPDLKFFSYHCGLCQKHIVTSPAIFWRKPGGVVCDECLNLLIEFARNHVMTQEEKDAQVCSFAYGNVHISKPTITRKDVSRAMAKLKAESPKERRP